MEGQGKDGLQEEGACPRPRPQVSCRFRLPSARLPLPQRRRRDGHHPAPRRAIPGRGRRAHPHQAAEGRAHRHRHRPAREPLLFHRHPGVHPCSQELQEARRRALHQCRRTLRERQTPEPTHGRASPRSSKPTKHASRSPAILVGWR